jgi:hypothetical protein
MDTLSAVEKSKTRMVFRVLAAIIAFFLLAVDLPLGLSGAFTETWWESWFLIISSLYAGIGLAVGARTGRWYNSPG